MKSAQKRIDEKVSVMAAAKDFSFQVLGSFHEEICDECGVKHGTPLAGGGKVILSIVGLKLLCYPHGIAYLSSQKRRTGRKPKDLLSSFGLRQEVLL